LDIRGRLHLDAHNYPLDNIFDVCSRLNGPLPVYHPQFLQQAILAGMCPRRPFYCVGKLQLVKTLLQKLERILSSKYDSNQRGKALSIDTFLGTPLDQILADTPVLTLRVDTDDIKGGDNSGTAQALQGFNFAEHSTNTGSFGESTPKRLEALLENTSLPYITSSEQIRLALIVGCMNDVWQQVCTVR
jgi:hypothetical protein